MIQGPDKNSYDFGIGYEPEIITYAKETLEIASRVSPVKCYILFRNATGSVVGSPSNLITVASYSVLNNNYRTNIWTEGQINHPDLRPYTNNGKGSIYVYIDNVLATRVLEENDLQNDNEFVTIQRRDLNPQTVELVFNNNYDPTSHTIQYYYSTIQSGIDSDRVKVGEDSSMSKFYWTQYLESATDFYRGRNQVLIRLPLNTRDIKVQEEGRVILLQRESWMIWTPYINNYDIIIVPETQSTTGEEERYEVVDKKDSVIQGSLISQRFKLRYLENKDPRYDIPYSTV